MCVKIRSQKNYIHIVLVVFICAETLLTKTNALPTKSQTRKASNGPMESIERLFRYGYIDPPKRINSGDPLENRRFLVLQQYSPHSFEEAAPAVQAGIKAFQNYFHLQVTGKLDEATMNLLSTPRCGNPDIIAQVPQTKGSHEEPNSLRRQKRHHISDDKLHWNKKKVTWRIQNYPAKELSRSRTHVVFQHAFNKWARVADLDFVEEKDFKKNADIIIKFGSKKHGDSIAFDGPRGVLAHAFYPMPEPVYSLAGDAHFDDDETWTDGPHEKFRNLISVAVHELGHSMGLGHSSVSTSVMFPYYMSKWSMVKLDENDVTEMQKIYGAPKPGKKLPPESSLPDIPPPPVPPTSSPDTSSMFDYCNISIDAIVEIRGLELYIFKRDMQWRVTWSKTVSTWVTYQFRDGPAKIGYYWNVLPLHIDYIDAAIERSDSCIYMFRGNRFWLLMDNKKMFKGVPNDGIPLTELGLPSYLESISTVFRWGVNKRIYLFAGEDYWVLNTSEGKFGLVAGAPDYPRKICNTWRGIPTPVTAAFTTLNGETLFFSGSNYYAFDNTAMRARPGYPKPARLGLIGCMDP